MEDKSVFSVVKIKKTTKKATATPERGEELKALKSKDVN